MNIHIVYYSGTGGTARVANCFQQSFEKRGIPVQVTALNRPNPPEDSSDFLVLLFAVYACNEPLPVTEWLRNLPAKSGGKAAVISVSGGGEVSPNTGCRAAAIRSLEKKGYDVLYEDMIVMPSNWIVPVPDELAALLLRAAPKRAEQTVENILAGKRRRTKPKLIDRLFSRFGRLEQHGGKTFAKKIAVSSACTGCEHCVKHCPRQNITLQDGKPVFGDRCVICLNCIYSCPQKALEPGTLRFVAIKEGYSLDAVERRTKDKTDFPPVEEMAKGYVWSGVRKYLREMK